MTDHLQEFPAQLRKILTIMSKSNELIDAMKKGWGASRKIEVTREVVGVVALIGHDVALYAYTLDEDSKAVDICDSGYIDWLKDTLAEKPFGTELERDGISWMFMED